VSLASNDDVLDVVIIGSGPAGYTAAIYAARAGLAPLVLAGSVTAGGALMNTTEVENFPGFPNGVMGPELMSNMQEQAEKFGAKVEWDDATSVDLAGPVKVIVTGNGDTYRGDSAVEEATFLTRFGSKVTMIHRRDELRASKIMADRALNDPKITFAWNSEVVRIVGENRVEQLVLRDTITGEESTLDATALFVAIGHEPRTELLVGQVDLDENGYIQVEGRSTRTNLPGVFACGDAVDHTYRQAITAAGTGCSAALDAQHYLAALDDAALAVAQEV